MNVSSTLQMHSVTCVHLQLTLQAFRQTAFITAHTEILHLTVMKRV